MTDLSAKTEDTFQQAHEMVRAYVLDAVTLLVQIMLDDNQEMETRLAAAAEVLHAAGLHGVL